MSRSIIGRVWVRINVEDSSTRHCVYTLRRTTTNFEKTWSEFTAILEGRVKNMKANHPTLEVTYTQKEVKHE